MVIIIDFPIVSAQKARQVRLISNSVVSICSTSSPGTGTGLAPHVYRRAGLLCGDWLHSEQTRLFSVSIPIGTCRNSVRTHPRDWITDLETGHTLGILVIDGVSISLH